MNDLTSIWLKEEICASKYMVKKKNNQKQQLPFLILPRLLDIRQLYPVFRRNFTFDLFNSLYSKYSADIIQAILAQRFVK